MTMLTRGRARASLDALIDQVTRTPESGILWKEEVLGHLNGAKHVFDALDNASYVELVAKLEAQGAPEGIYVEDENGEPKKIGDTLSESPPKDDRIVYGAQCIWWDSIDKVGHRSGGLPCCPHCQGVLFEIPNEAIWWAGVDTKQLELPGYRKMIEWSRGKHWTSYDDMLADYENSQKATGV